MSQNPKRENVIRQIHESDLQLSMAITGGGSKLIGELLAVPGASNTLLDANIPYSQRALADFLGRQPDSFCSAETSKWMAVSCYFESLKIHQQNVTAFACTAALTTGHAKKGQHRFYKSIQTRSKTKLVQVTLDKGQRTRFEEEEIIVELGLAELAKIIDVSYEPTGLTDRDLLIESERHVKEEWTQVFHDQLKYCHANQSGKIPPRGIGLLPGSFNPLHDGHLEMAEKFERLFGIKVHFELAIKNADKPPLDFLSINDRVLQFDEQDVWITNTATFAEKAAAFPGNMFIVGVDTIIRIADPKYYKGPDGLQEAIESLDHHQCKFAVFGRSIGNGFKELSDMNLPPELARLCEEIPESTFRNDTSSTQLRSQNGS